MTRTLGARFAPPGRALGRGPGRGAGAGGAAQPPREARRGRAFRLPSWQRERVPGRSLAVFTRQFATMVDAGVPLVQCLAVLGDQEDDARLASAIRAVRAEVEGGSGLADAMRRHPAAFDGLYTNLIAAGESGGILDAILARLASCIETNVKLRGQVRSALTYPAAVVAIAAAAVGVILWTVIPTFAALFEGMGATLPWPTRAVIAASDSLVVLFPAFVAVLAAARRLFDGSAGPSEGGAQAMPPCSVCRWWGRSCARSRWRGSAAPCRRCSARECRFSKAWPSPPGRPATR